MPGSNCSYPACDHVTKEGTLDQEIALLNIHIRGAHQAVVAPPGGQDAGKSRAEKIPRPKIKFGIGGDEFLFFKGRWESYKRAGKLADAAEIRDQLVAACDEDLARDLHRSMGSKLDTATEAELLLEIEHLCVIPQNNLVNVVKLLALTQDRDKPVRSFLARLKGCASICKLTVKCTSMDCDEDVSYSENVILHALVKGLADSEIQQEVLADGEDKCLDETVKYVEAKEAGKRSVGQLGEAGLSSSQLNKLTLYKAAQQDKMMGPSEKCCYCNRQGGMVCNLTMQ